MPAIYRLATPTFWTESTRSQSSPVSSKYFGDEIIPLLEDYCYEDYAALGDIVGTGLVDTVNQAIRSELFEDSNRADLVQALMQAYPEMSRHLARRLRRKPRLLPKMMTRRTRLQLERNSHWRLSLFGSESGKR